MGLLDDGCDGLFVVAEHGALIRAQPCSCSPPLSALTHSITTCLPAVLCRYEDADIHWQKLEDKYHFSCQVWGTVKRRISSTTRSGAAAAGAQRQGRTGMFHVSSLSAARIPLPCPAVHR